MANQSENATVCKAIDYTELPSTYPLSVIPCNGFYEFNSNISCATTDMYHCIDLASSCVSLFAN